jgi:lipopolysaccharide heptosyltransferase I
MALTRILIVKLSSLGDVVHALPVAGALRRRFPAASISWLAGPAAAPVVTMCRHVHHLLVWRPGRRPRLQMWSELRALRPQVSLDLQGLVRTSGLAWMSGARWRVGFRSWQEGGLALCNLPAISPRSDLHAVDAYLEFASYLGADQAGVDYGLRLPEKAREYGARAVGSGGSENQTPAVALLPGTRWATKKWPARHFAAVAAMLGERGVRCVVLGGPDEREAGAGIAAAAPGTVCDLSGRTSLAQSAGVMINCALAVGNDSGPMHLAVALGVPVVALYGPTDPVRTGPHGSGHTVLQAAVRCVGCRRRRCGVRCMETISPERVLEAALQRLARSREHA